MSTTTLSTNLAADMAHDALCTSAAVLLSGLEDRPANVLTVHNAMLALIALDENHPEWTGERCVWCTGPVVWRNNEAACVCERVYDTPAPSHPVDERGLGWWAWRDRLNGIA